MYVVYGNIYHQYTPNVSIYTSTMDPMGYAICISKAPGLRRSFGDGSKAVGVYQLYPLVMTNIAIENDHRNSGFSHETW